MPTSDSEPRSVVERAKNVDRAPDITSDEYWDTHHIAVVRVADVAAAPAEPRRVNVTHTVVNRISDAEIEAERTTPLGHWRFANEPRGASPVAPGDTVVAFYPRDNPAAVTAIRLETAPEQSALVNRLNRIARLRSGEGGPGALKEAVFDLDRDVALYSLKRLLKQESRDLDQAFLTRLRTLADTPEADPEVRMLAEQLLRTMGGGGTEQEFAWLESALSTAQGHDWTRLRTLALRLLDFPDKRAQAASLLTSLARDPAKPRDVHIAAYSVFEDPRLFPQDRTDTVSDLVFDTVEQMAQSPDELLRQAGAMLLHNLTTRVNPQRRRLYVERARSVLQSALTREKNPASTNVIQRSLDLLSPREGEP